MREQNQERISLSTKFVEFINAFVAKINMITPICRGNHTEDTGK